MPIELQLAPPDFQTFLRPFLTYHSSKEMIMSDCGLYFLFAFEQNLSGIIQKTLLKVVHTASYSVVSIKQTGCNKQTEWSKNFIYYMKKKDQGGAKISFST